MQAACPSLAPDSAFVSGVLGYVDCEAQALGLGGWQGMTGAGSANTLILTGMLTIFIALIGYRLLLGETPTLRDGVVALVKIGIVIALATSWSAFRTLAYDVAMHGPAELATQIGGPSGLPGAGGGLIGRLQGVDNELIELNTLGTGKPPDADVIAGPTAVPLSPQQQQQQIQDLQRRAQRPKWDPANDAKMLSEARTYYLTGVIAAFASVRIVTGLLLALGPLFVLFLLFDGTRGLFEGWVRGLVGAALGALSTAIVLGVELALLEPWLAMILAERHVDNATPAVPVELMVVTLAFGLTLIATLAAAAWVARGFRLPAAWRVLPARIAEVVTPQVPRLMAPAAHHVAGDDQRSRAIAVSDAVAAAQRREAGSPAASLAQSGRQVTAQALSREIMVAAPVPLGQSFRRRTRGRISSGAARRDGGR